MCAALPLSSRTNHLNSDVEVLRYQTRKDVKIRYEGPNKGLKWTNLLFGIGLACAAFMFAELPVEAWNAGIVGTLIGCCSAAALPFRPSMNSSRMESGLMYAPSIR